jgi:hypothetical protein
MVQHPVARVLQKFINLHRTQLQSFLFIYLFFIYFYIYTKDDQLTLQKRGKSERKLQTQVYILKSSCPYIASN